MRVAQGKLLPYPLPLSTAYDPHGGAGLRTYPSHVGTAAPDCSADRKLAALVC